MTALKVLQLAFLIVFVTYMSGLIPLISCDDDSNSNQNENQNENQDENQDDFDAESCQQQTTYFLSDQQSLKVDFYYDAAVEPDASFILSMCKARKVFKHVTFSFFVGITVKRGDDGSLECPNSDESSTDCTYALLDACASQLVPDFSAYVCCNYDTTDGAETVEECYQRQCDNLDEFESCAALEDPNIKPDEILLQNAENAFAAYPNEDCWPFLGFNGQTEQCARASFYDDPVKVICAMLAEGVEDECDSQ